MEDIFLPSKVEFKEDEKDKNRAVLTVEPCHPGYGTTLGNALRRVMLSSLPGAAVTAVRIKGVSHEFSTLPGVKEDVVEIILNLKKLRLKILVGEEPVILVLKVKGEKKVKAKDIEKNPVVEIANPDLEIATLTSKEAELEMKIWAEKGRGYVPTEERKLENLELDVIAVDSIFTPIKKVGLQVENVRVGERTDYDKLILDIETDGTLTPSGAVEQAAKILIKQFSLFMELKKEKVEEIKELAEEITEEIEEVKEEKEKVSTESEAPIDKKKRGRPKKAKD